MMIAECNKALSRLIVGAISIDGSLSKAEREHLASTLSALGASHLLPEIGTALDDDFSDFDLFTETKIINESRPSEAQILELFSLVCNVISSDRFVSKDEASFLSALSRSLKISQSKAKSTLLQALKARNGRIEISGNKIDPLLHPHLKELLSFEGADEIVGEIPKDSLEELLQVNSGNLSFSEDEVKAAIKELGLTSFSSLDEAEEAWKDLIKSSNVSALADQGIEYAEAALLKLLNATKAIKIIRAFSTSL